jgi:hypothetical protein
VCSAISTPSLRSVASGGIHVRSSKATTSLSFIRIPLGTSCLKRACASIFLALEGQASGSNTSAPATGAKRSKEIVGRANI